MLTFDEEKQNKKIQGLRHDEEEELAKILSSKYGAGYVDLSTVSISTDALRCIPEATARENNVAAFSLIGKKINVAALAPSNPSTTAVLEELVQNGYIPNLYMVSKASLERAWDRYKDMSYASETKDGILDISNEDIRKVVSQTKSLDDVRNLIAETLKLKKSYRISRIVEIILSGALATDASDIHIEPEEDFVRLRLRLNGVLTEVITFDKETYDLLASRIKLLSNLKLNIKENSQDGRFSIKILDKDIEIRSSTLPGAYGESIVMRILNPDTISVPMEALGMEPELLATIQREINRPNGMILNTGPTGSGKTTTLYAFLKKIHTPDIKIITIEDPIEYHLPGVVQSQVDKEKGYTFAAGLRSALRQDPDVIMVGEIRDEETAEIAINSALTGHLVFSTLHTNNAAGAFPRFIDLGLNPKVLSSSVNVAMAQRLVRKLCNFCKRETVPTADEKKLLNEIQNTLHDKTKALQTDKVWTAVGCDKCNKSGYKGRLGIFEAVLMTEEIETIIKENPSEREIKKAALSQGILTLQQDAALKILRGVTSIDEVRRVLDLEEDLLSEAENILLNEERELSALSTPEPLQGDAPSSPEEMFVSENPLSAETVSTFTETTPSYAPEMAGLSSDTLPEAPAASTAVETQDPQE